MLLCNIISESRNVNPQPLATNAQPQGHTPAAPAMVNLPMVYGSRVTNIVMNAQVQLAYGCAVAARDRAQRATDCIERSWPDTPVRRLVLDIYRAQAQSADVVAHEVLESARRHCGLAFAHL